MTHLTTPRLGFIGTGSIASALVEGFSSGAQAFPVLVSPRNEARSRNLEQRWPNVRRAGSNQDVLEGSDVVFIALRAPAAGEVVPRLDFRADQRVISLIPVIPHAQILDWVQPASQVFKALPMPFVARHLGQIPYFPAGEGAAAVLGHLCEPLPMQQERDLIRFITATTVTSTFYSFMQAVHDWCVAGGIPPESAKSYLASYFSALTRMAEGEPTFAALAAEAATPGGLNELALRRMQGGTMFPDLDATLAAVLERFQPPANR